MLTIERQISHHGHNFTVICDDWRQQPTEAAMAGIALCEWLKSHTPTQTSVLHYVLSFRQREGALHCIELDELDAAALEARAAGLADIPGETPADGRTIYLVADCKAAEDAEE